MPRNLLDYQLCTNKNLLGGKSFEGSTTHSQQRHPFAYLALSVVCRVKLAVCINIEPGKLEKIFKITVSN